MTFRELLYKECCKPYHILTPNLAKRLKIRLEHITKATHDNVMTQELEHALNKHHHGINWRKEFNKCDKVEDLQFNWENGNIRI